AAVSDFTRSLALKHYPVNIKVIPNGVDLEAINPGEIVTQEPPHIVFAGRFMEQKNPLQIVRTLAAVRDLRWTCALLGDGPLRPSVEREIANAGLVDRFTLTGWVTPEEVLDWFGRSDILFMPSRSEGLPVVGVQALAMGLAIVASRVGGFVDLVSDGKNGWLLDCRDQPGFESVLRKLLGSPGELLKMRQNSRVIAHRFDIRWVVDAYEGLLTEAAQSRSRGKAG
ncbi:MAG: glycosyltransferase family 4 protein, partial [Anaerolineaceae bacterium]|nr:glycosyltransferase family 4 protein [Anaerolineaceae bacterium]